MASEPRTGRSGRGGPRRRAPRPAGNARLRVGAVGTDPREAAVAMVQAVCEERTPLSAVLDESRAGSLAERDHALARAIVRTTVRRRGDIDTILSDLMARPLPRRAGRARAILRVAAAQLLFMRQADHAAVNVAVDLLKADAATAGYRGLANAVLRRLARERDGLLSGLRPEANTPAWLYARWLAAYGADAAAATAEVHREEPPLDLALVAGAEPPAGAAPLFTGGARLSSTSVERIEGYDQGRWWVQDAAAQLPATLLGDVAGLEVLDLCAAPGGKTMQLAAAGAHVTAVDADADRLARLAKNLARTGLAGRVTIVERDAREVEGTFDAVLLDAPCSATGTIRRQPDVAWSKTPADIAALAALQRELLRHAADLVRPGGRLVFATCSLEPEEGEEHVRFAADELPALQLEPVREDPAAAFASPSGAMRTLPHSPLPGAGGLRGLDGFFAVRVRRLA